MIVLEGLHHRDHKYDVYVSSLECLVHPRLEFVSRQCGHT
jgi:hypothetical protein